ncbi:cytochrome p450, partial [Trifolium pratense]
EEEQVERMVNMEVRDRKERRNWRLFLISYVIVYGVGRIVNGLFFLRPAIVAEFSRSECDLSGKRRLWETLIMSKRGFGGGVWCVIGDFNAVLRREERKGDLLGSNPNGISMSIIDRMLVSDDWSVLWNNPSLWVLPRSVSDHCPIVVRYAVTD